MSQTGFAFPDFNIPEAKKDEQWHKDCVLAIVNNTLTGSYDFNYRSMTECYDFYNGTHTGDEFNFLQTAEDGDVLPAKWIPYNKIRVKVDLLLGEMNRKKYEVSVNAINKEAKSRKLEMKDQLFAKMRMKPINDDLEQRYGMAVQDQSYVPEDEDELDDYIEYEYKEKSEIVMKSALKYLSNLYSWNYLRLALFRDILITGRCFVKNEVHQGLPCFRRIDPRNVLFDPNATDDFLSDATYVGEVRYMGIAEAAEKYNLDKEQIQALYSKYKEIQNNTGGAFTNSSFSRIIDGVKNVQMFRNDSGVLRVLVYSAEWLDTKIVAYKNDVDNYGGKLFKRVKDTYKGEIAKKSTIKIVRKGTLIGGDIMVDWGEAKNQIRDVDRLYDTKLSYVCLLPNYVNGRAISKVEQMSALQKLKDITMYNMQLAMSRAGSKGFIYDVSQCPEDWDIHTVLKYLKSVGIAFINSKVDGVQSQFNQFQSIDMTLSASVEQYLNISMMIDREMDAVSGINEARQGIVQNSSQAVGVTQSALTQSNLSTETLFEFFAQYAGRIWTYQAGLVKLTFLDNDKFSPIIGDSGVDFLKEDIKLDLDDYGVFVTVQPPLVEDRQQLTMLVNAAVQSGQLTFLDAIKLLKEKDIDVAIRQMERTLEKKQKQQQQMQMAQQMQQQQADQQMQAQQHEADLKAQAMQGAQAVSQQAAQQQAAMAAQQDKQAHDVRGKLMDGRIAQILAAGKQ